MTTMCLSDYHPLPSAMILRPAFGSDPQAERKIAAGRAAFEHALTLGYCRTAAEAWRRKARREWLPGETPEACARRIVVRMPGSVLPGRGQGSAA